MENLNQTSSVNQHITECKSQIAELKADLKELIDAGENAQLQEEIQGRIKELQSQVRVFENRPRAGYDSKEGLHEETTN
jgi:regulator of replication initiation timing